MENSRNKEPISFNLYTILRSALKSHLGCESSLCSAYPGYICDSPVSHLATLATFSSYHSAYVQVILALLNNKLGPKVQSSDDGNLDMPKHFL
jgi:hypothetical protein